MKTPSKVRPRVTRERRTEPRPPLTAVPGPAHAPVAATGYVDIFGYSNAAGGWLFCGWIERPESIEQSNSVEATIRFEQTQCSGAATLSFYQREDLDHRGIGVVAFVSGSSRAAGLLEHVALAIAGTPYQLTAGHASQRLADHDMVARVRTTLVKQAFVHTSRDHLLSIISRPGFAGVDTLATLSEPVLLEIDEAFLCPPGDVLLKGWLLAIPGVIRSIRVRSGPLVGALKMSESIRVDRADVIAAFGPETGFVDTRCGFIARVPAAISKGDISYLEVELESGEVGFKPFKISKHTGIHAIKQILNAVDVRYDELDQAFDGVLGPAISLLNAARSPERGPTHTMQFGASPSTPKHSLIIPLYGRVDFLEYQMALFSRHAGIKETEILYVLDDPPKRRELEVLAHSTFERFGIPFTVLILPENLGFAPASNAGLLAARGQYICFLNSDIFPIKDDWLETLTERLEQHPGVGVIGPRLLFEDGTIQHEGCLYRPIKEFGNWFFVDHLNKGRIADDFRGMRTCDAITGACMVMSRSLALELGGFDEAFVIGDFEDSDLCLKVRQRGLSCAVACDCQLYHLERKSQTAPGHQWRMNITLYNAWVHQRRWAPMLTASRSPSSP
jgi:GT2 family glycosyltransferase